MVGGLYIILTVPKGKLEIEINNHYHPNLDYFFYYITYLGDGAFSIPVIILLFFRKIYYGILSALSFIFSTVVVQTIKHFIYPNMPRPSAYFEKTLNLHYVPYVELWKTNSFPSGHTAGAFTVFLILAIVYKNKYLDVFFFVIAFLVGLSRVYLLQHFFIDTYFGALIGVTITLFIYYLTAYRANWQENTSLNKSVINLFSRNEAV